MTKERAIEILGQYGSNFYWKDGQPIPGDMVAEAICMAIDSLSGTSPLNVVHGDGGFASKEEAKAYLFSKPTLVICPSCGKVASWNSYFSSYNCGYCGWRGKDWEEYADERPSMNPNCHGLGHANCEICDSPCPYR